MEFHYRCSECGNTYPLTPEIMVCPGCHKLQNPDEPLRGILEVVLEGSVDRGFSSFDLLPVEAEQFPPIPVGNTPLWKPKRLRERFGMPRLYIKDDSTNPTGSLKDRASYLVAAFAAKFHRNEIVLASTGNAGSSMSGVGASAGLRVRLYLPETAPPAKRIQALQYGAELIEVSGTYDQAYDLSLEWCRKEGGLSRNTAHNPLTIEGKKTVSIEIFRQLGDSLPDHLFVPVGDGVIISGVYKGFRDLAELGVTDRIPQIYCVQAEGSMAVSRALRNGGEFTLPVRSTTRADSIAVDIPRGGRYAVRQIMQNAGRAVVTTDSEIAHAQRDLASFSGLFLEPAAATAYAGYLKIREEISPEESVVILATGSGLKDIEFAKRGVLN